MFRFVCNNSKLFNGDSSQKLLQSLLLRHLSCDSTHCIPSNSFTVSYLIASCGLSPDKAITASTKVKFLSPTNPDSVLTLFRNHGIPDTHISKLIQIRPSLLTSKPYKTLNPKLEFFKSLGFSGTALARLILCRGSLSKAIIPSVAILKTLVNPDSKLVTMLGRSIRILQDPAKYLIPNVELLRAHGVPESNITSLLVNQPRSFMNTPVRFKEIVEQVERIGFDPKKSMFVRGVQAMVSMSESSRKAKFDVYKKWGWSEDVILRAFRAEPMCLMLSKRAIMEKMNFFVYNLGYDPLEIAKYPRALKYSMEKRIIPRFKVIEILKANGLLEKTYLISTILVVSDKKFFKMFVNKFEKVIPELSKAYQVCQKTLAVY